MHDSDALPGLASRLVNRFVTRTAVGVAAANARLPRSGIVTGTPVRSQFFSVAPIDPRGSTRHLLLFGGSQGAAVLNRTLAAAAPLLAADRLEVIHQTGDRHVETTRAAYGAVPAGWRLEPFLPRLYEELAWADLVVARAGAMTLAELAGAGRPAILVPFGAAAHGHQLANARAHAAAGAAVVIEEDVLTPSSLASAVRDLFRDRNRLAEMGRCARTLAVPDAAARLADLLLGIAK
jgi:UDP-N-acetylglucosamine--N-acetylmuramyl-(pentapeptide) pyrophosphoryl-undecaprenol N-acetylglucosamine transferase